MSYFSLFILSAVVSITYGQDFTLPRLVLQGSSDCSSKKPLCNDGAIYYRTGWRIGNDPENDIERTSQGAWSCLKGREENSAWFWLKLQSEGAIEFYLRSLDDADLDYVLWGPFDAPETGCGANLQWYRSDLSPGNQISCGSNGGASIPGQGLSYEKVVIPASQAYINKYYTLLVNDAKGNTTFVLQPITNSAGQITSVGKTDCTAIRDVSSYFMTVLNSTINATYNGTAVVGSPVMFTAIGYLLNSVPYRDAMKTVRSTDDCSAPVYGVDREGVDLGPGDDESTRWTEWYTTFILPGLYRLCYQLYGNTYVPLGGPFRVLDNRPRPVPRPPRGLHDAEETNRGIWFSFTPQQILFNITATLRFYGFETYGYIPVQGGCNPPEVEVKVVVENCLESTQSVPGGEPRIVRHDYTADFKLTQLGQYMLCVKHRLEWEEVEGILTVTTRDNTLPYAGYYHCQQYLDETPQPSKCGCFYDGHFMAPGASAILPTTYPALDLVTSRMIPRIDQGCCAFNTMVRQSFRTVTNVTWGYCSAVSNN